MKYENILKKSVQNIKDLLKTSDKNAEDLIKRTISLHALGIEKRHLKELFAYNEIDEHNFKHILHKITRQIERIETNIAQIKTLDFDFKSIISHIFVVKTSKRDELREFLLNKNIECGIHYKPNHLLTKYKTNSLPITEKLYEEILTLPCQLDLTKEEQDYVITSIQEFFNA